MRQIRASLLALIAAGLVAACSRTPSTVGPVYRPNVLIVLVDALRGDRLGINGYPLPVTPQIDRLASEGWNFRAAFAHSSWTKPSIATLFTSLYPGQHGLDRVGFLDQGEFYTDVLGESFVTLAESFQGAGYATGAVVNQVHLQARFGFSQGFDHYDTVRGYPAERLNARMLRWLEGLDEEPFFAYIHYLDAHWPYRARSMSRQGVFGPTKMSRRPPPHVDDVDEWLAGLDDPADVEALRALYDGELAYIDAAVGFLIRNLQEMGRYDDTIVVVTSDHGESFLEHGELVHGYSPYEEMLHVPLVIRLPEPLRQGGPEVSPPVGLVDVMPTLLDLAGLEVPAGVQGRSLVPLAHGGRDRSRLIFAATADATAVRSSQYKLIRFSEGSFEFYDLEADPTETNPEIGACGDICTELARKLDAYLEAMERARSALEGSIEGMTEQEVKDLEALGYL